MFNKYYTSLDHYGKIYQEPKRIEQIKNHSKFLRYCLVIFFL